MMSEKRTVLITGATSGIGQEIALRFASNGWNILCHYHSSKEKAGKLKKKIISLGVRCDIIRADLSSTKQADRLEGKLDGYDIDSLVNNAGTYTVCRHFSDLKLDDILKTFMVNTFAPMLISSGIFLRMKERRFGRIVNISSISAKYGGSSHSMHYGCSKRSLEGVTKTLAKEGAEFNVLANTVRPGVIDTEFHMKFPKDMKKRIAMIPVKKMGTPENIADMVYYLGSEQNSFITNQVITISGGE